jgi:hypothetical protein
MSAENSIHLTDKQQYWLDHIRQAQASDQSLRQYAHEQALSLKALYQYRWLLRKKGVLNEVAEAPAFVKVAPPVAPAPYATVTVQFPNGIRVELTGYDQALPGLLTQVHSL